MNEELTIAVCDDDAIVCEAVSAKIVKFFTECGVTVNCDKYVSAGAMYNNMKSLEKKYDVLFLDIEMPKINGIDLAKAFRKNGDKSDIIFVSNREDRVFDTFGVRPFGFVRKNNFNRDLKDALRSYLNTRILNNTCVGLKTDNNSVVRKVRVADIVYIESYRYKQSVYLADGEELSIRMTMKELEEKLSAYDVVRIHQGYLVNLKYVQRIERSGVLLNYKDGVLLSISRDKVQELKTIYLEYLRKTGEILFDD